MIIALVAVFAAPFAVAHAASLDAAMLGCLVLLLTVNPVCMIAVGFWAARHLRRRWPALPGCAGLIWLCTSLAYQDFNAAFAAYAAIYLAAAALACAVARLLARWRNAACKNQPDRVQ